MNIFRNRFVNIAILVLVALVLRFYFEEFLGEENATWIRVTSIIVILGVGAVFVLRGIANIIEETTEILSERTKIASGLLQSLGTAFPDMILGIVAAIMSLRLVSSDYALAINFAIIAAATTFGSNIYNIGHAAWCVFRQNISNKKEKPVLMMPGIKGLGTVIPMKDHTTKPSLMEIDESVDILNVLTILTAVVAISMVVFGQVANPPENVSGDLYQLVKPAGFVILALCILTMYIFRKTKRQHILVQEIAKEERYYAKKSTFAILFILALSGAAILFAAESMVSAVQVFCDITGMPFVIAGVLAGVIGCMGEMIVVHNFTINPKGRIGDALVGVGMDNIVTTMGASIVAVMGGIFLGGNALILIFVIILALNTVLIWQISKMKNYFLLH
ncbi:MAG: hypothetical protein A2599_01800 [Candidatus Staskawiczbacteria bacterium RIFOXYD1_FULL_39_28]|uniref:Sodium/calcium exchanger membrane region domain-containing protein n=1 Tax=Candidatus Staskawiczbacteria bacterium RIFOXYC1_FULL_38_18 TaxID=1802229 RepID=A0A1G2JA75_9BACT|nr:MAG: hypothetical protein A2401_02915 [Candidatus Staskawiczbacteria bacterium RIFOXYC1_FULL_38_18]OGZ91764.1 MAG: hypothetical protein A2599_01800 [Candidatus Staskawiczbacteria bacterium RIFOXYD1_FULL_39_28]